MPRKYVSPRREESAANTRQAIVEAAVKLHGEGITTLSAVAEEAGVSLPTVNRHFPTREDLFQACTTHVAEGFAYPDPAILASIQDRRERLDHLVRRVYHEHEKTMGQAWTGYMLEDESAVMAQSMAGIDVLVRALVEALLHDWDDLARDSQAAAGFVEAMLSPLTYRALRLKGNLDHNDAVRQMASALGNLLGV